MAYWATTPIAGSSPHTRGAPRSPPAARPPSGIIPAYAGCTAIRHSFSCKPRDHPRIRGVHSTPPNPVGLALGSSPHTRGAQALKGATINLARIIPAYAGCTFNCLMTRIVCGDHPRIRGVHEMTWGTPWERRGSSPHTRGARTRPMSTNTDRRIIPAYAGCTIPSGWPCLYHTDHPRIRGVHYRVLDVFV